MFPDAKKSTLVGIGKHMIISFVMLMLKTADYLYKTKAITTDWSYTNGRHFCNVCVNLLFRVPLGSVLGPLLYLLFSADVFNIIADCGLVGHSYANDTQVYVSTSAADASVAVQRLADCTERIDE
jgi:hypothetical protein